MAIELKMNEENVASYNLDTAALDFIMMHLDNEHLTNEQVEEIFELFTGIQTFRDSFEANGWTAESLTISVPLFFMLCDLGHSYQAEMSKMKHILEGMVDIRMDCLRGLSAAAKRLRWNTLIIQFNNCRNALIARTNEIISLFDDIINILQYDLAPIVLPPNDEIDHPAPEDMTIYADDTLVITLEEDDDEVVVLGEESSPEDDDQNTSS